jgi:hypothetical protein
MLNMFFQESTSIKIVQKLNQAYFTARFQHKPFIDCYVLYYKTRDLQTQMHSSSLDNFKNDTIEITTSAGIDLFIESRFMVMPQKLKIQREKISIISLHMLLFDLCVQ